jgi:hypothetical protein
MYKFEASQSSEQVFKVVYWHLLVERFQEVFDYELTELMKQVDWALAISIALLSALLLNGRGQATPVPFYEKLFLGALLGSVIAGLGPSFGQFNIGTPSRQILQSGLESLR